MFFFTNWCSVLVFKVFNFRLSVALLGRLLYLQKARDVSFVADSHGDDVLKQPEEWPLVTRFRSSLVQEAVKLEKQPPGALWRGDG